MRRLKGLPLPQPWLLCLAVLLLGPLCAPAAPGDSTEGEDRKMLEEAGLGADGPGLLDFFRKRTLKADQRARIAGLIKLLGADEFETRQSASQELVKVGPVARPQLQGALKDRDLEVRRRAERALELIAKAGEAAILPAAVRQLGRQAPAGSIKTLLDYLPNVEEAEVAEQVVRTLSGLGTKGGKADPVLLSALADKQTLRRAAAGEALAPSKDPKARERVRHLLRDPVMGVRKRVALALYEARDPESVAALIDLVTELPREDQYVIEERLINLAGEKAPPYPDRDTPETRKTYQAAWARWWKDNRAKIDLAKVNLTPRMYGYTLITAMENTGVNGRVFEMDAAGKTRWEIRNLRYPIFAQVTGPDRVLVVEYSTNTISERTFKGEILSQRPVGGLAVGAQRLANGHTLIVARNQIREVDRAGKDVLTIPRPNDVASAARFRDGTFGVLTTTGQCLRLDKAGKTLRAFNVGPMSTALGHRAEFLPNGHVIVPSYSQSKVREYDGTGKVIWEATVTRPQSVSRLRNGHTLVSSRLGRRVVELDRNGKEVWNYSGTVRPLFATRR